MFVRVGTALLLWALATTAFGQTLAKKRLLFDLTGGAGGLTFTRSNGADDLMRLSGALGCGVQYGFGKRIGTSFRFERAGARRGILEAGPSRTGSYTLALHIVVARWPQGDLDLALGLGSTTISLAADRGRFPREASGGTVRAAVRWSHMWTPTLGWSLSGHVASAAPIGLADEHGTVLLADGSPLLVGFRQFSVQCGLLVRF